MGVFGSGSPKRHRLFSNDELLLTKLCCKAGYMSRADQASCSSKLVRKYIDKNGIKRCVGNKDALKASAYLVLCKTILLYFYLGGLELSNLGTSLVKKKQINKKHYTILLVLCDTHVIGPGCLNN